MVCCTPSSKLWEHGNTHNSIDVAKVMSKTQLFLAELFKINWEKRAHNHFKEKKKRSKITLIFLPTLISKMH